ncbi:MAG: UbiX family flavin prenyltransferase [Thermoanaerobaculia bacterium]
MAESGKEIVVGVSGASGAGLAVGFLRVAARRPEFSRIHLVVSQSAISVARSELGNSQRRLDDEADYLNLLELGGSERARITLHSNLDLAAPISSGSFPTAGMVVIPCSAGTLASVANGTSRGLLQRAADVTLKERRPLVLAFRESPYSRIHIRNMLHASEAGATMMPPAPAFYIESQSLDRLMEAYFWRVAGVFGIALPEEFVWRGPRKG